jgi:hypothetical protein
MAASLKDKRTPITTPPYQVPSVDVTPDPPIFSLATTFNVGRYSSVSSPHRMQEKLDKTCRYGTCHRQMCEGDLIVKDGFQC